MAPGTDTVKVWHITPISNLASILAAAGLLSDAKLAAVPHEVIGYSHIKERRLTQYRIPCCANRFVGEFVPFYFCPRSPMLYTINLGRTGKEPGCQKDVLHLSTTVAHLMALGQPWAISDGNAGAAHTLFYDDIAAIARLDWPAIRATIWAGRQHAKSAEFLLADFVPIEAIVHIGCFDQEVARRVRDAIRGVSWSPLVTVERHWYY